MKSQSSIVEIFRRRQSIAADPSLRERDERLEALKHLVGRIAHDFNNFLAPIMGYVALIKEEVGEGSIVSKYAGTLEQSARRSEDEIASILSATQPQRKFHPVMLDFTGMIAEEIRKWEQSLATGSGIRLRRELDHCEWECDANQWRAVIAQLLKNSRFALAMGGDLMIRLKQVEWGEVMSLNLGLVGESGWMLEVEDTGIGMNQQGLQRAFDPYYSTRPKNQALGIGLTMVHSVVRWHGAQVVMDSKEEGGTRVTIWLPRFKSEVPGPKEPPQSPSLSKLRPPARLESLGNRVLVVDDDPMVLEVLKSSLQRLKYEVHTATDGAEAFRLFERKPNDWLLVISDVTMPVMDGIELARKIRGLRSNMKIVLVTGDSEAARETSMNSLMPDPPPVLRKPFPLKALVEPVNAVLVSN